MKNRKLAIVAFLLVAVLTIGVGYAALTDVLTIRGSVEAKAEVANLSFDEHIYFKDATVTKGNTTGETNKDYAAVTADNDIASFTCNSLEDGTSECIFTYTIVNESEHNATVSVEATMAGNSSVNPSHNNEAAFDIAYSFPNGTDLPKGGEITVEITVSFKDGVTPPTSGSVTAQYVLELTATSAD